MSDNADPVQGEPLRIEANYAGSEATIILAGEFDLTGAEQFGASVSEALATSPRSITLHVPDLTFIDSSGLRALLHARAAATDAGVAFRVSEPSPALRRIAEMTGIKDLLEDE
jgi:anti-sigma B factor antagonist